MSDFDYIVRTEGGARKTGSITAENYNSAIEKLQSQKFTVVKLNEADTSFDFVKPFLNRLSLEIEKICFLSILSLFKKTFLIDFTKIKESLRFKLLVFKKFSSFL